jgi:hypothetical protein
MPGVMQRYQGAVAFDGAAMDGTGQMTVPLGLMRVTTTQKNALTGVTGGYMVFDTTLSKACVYTGAAWETITSV